MATGSPTPAAIQLRKRLRDVGRPAVLQTVIVKTPSRRYRRHVEPVDPPADLPQVGRPRRHYEERIYTRDGNETHQSRNRAVGAFEYFCEFTRQRIGIDVNRLDQREGHALEVVDVEQSDD